MIVTYFREVVHGLSHELHHLVTGPSDPPYWPHSQSFLSTQNLVTLCQLTEEIIVTDMWTVYWDHAIDLQLSEQSLPSNYG